MRTHYISSGAIFNQNTHSHKSYIEDQTEKQSFTAPCG